MSLQVGRSNRVCLANSLNADAEAYKITVALVGRKENKYSYTRARAGPHGDQAIGKVVRSIEARVGS